MHRTEHAVKVTIGSGRGTRTFMLPVSQREEVENFIFAHTKESSVPAEEVFPELADDARRPAVMLRGSRYKADMTQKKLAELLGIRQHHLSEMENGKRSIGRKMAKRLAEVFDCDYRLFI